ncbi:MAG: MBL fold metallo-hydrolase [Acidobacteriota bacterium]|nr:MBL fold metallo-hydrolase [Acidobacteriota bacterium]
MPSSDSSPTVWQVETLHTHLEAGDSFFIFDVRNEDEYESWKIEGTVEIPMMNVPYYAMLESDEFDDVIDSFKAYLQQGTVEKLPREVPILAVCAKGDTSAFVAEALRRLGFPAFNLEGGTQAWGDHYHPRVITESEELAVYQIGRPARGCLSYVVASNGTAAIIDPLRHVEHYLELAQEKSLAYELILDTHAHADHISGGPTLAEKIGAPYFLHPYDGIHPIDVLPATIPYEYLRDGQTFQVGAHEMVTLHIPGHTLGNVAYLLDGKYLFTGDSIFIESIARPDLGGRGDTWAPIHHQSLRRLLELPDDTTVLPAHFSTLNESDDQGLFAAPLGTLRKKNGGLLEAQKSQQEFVEYILASLPKFPDEYIEIKRVNAGLAKVGESKASELELGKNICAVAQARDQANT